MSELIFDETNAFDPSATFVVPASPITQGTAIRLRISTDEVGSSLGSCDDVTRGQVEDYSVTLSPTNIIEPISFTFKVYPNPANEVLNIQTNDVIIDNIQLFNIVSQQIRTIKSTTNQTLTTINVSDLSIGTYFIKLTGRDGQQSTQKIIIK